MNDKSAGPEDIVAKLFSRWTRNGRDCNPTDYGFSAAVIEALRAAGHLNEWRPIDEAAKSGETMLIARHMDIWGWVRGWGSYERVKGIEGWVARGAFSEVPGVLGLGNPTHYCPLPKPPGDST